MNKLSRITFDPAVMGGKPCIRGMRVTVGMVVGLVASGHNPDKILELYPYLEKKDIEEALLKELETGVLLTVNENKSRVRILPLT